MLLLKKKPWLANVFNMPFCNPVVIELYAWCHMELELQ